ncbi:MAG: GtrA family protein [Ruminococcaceae bacterium]|nr:GtrA family protein [Oscillospiraceae bacterium]
MTEFLNKYKSAIFYVLFGGLTTVVDWGVSFLLYFVWGDVIAAERWMIHLADAIAWIAAVAFAYVTNRIWVFESKRCGFCPVLGEIAAFVGGRFLTFLLQEALMAIFFTWLGFNEYVVKICAAVIVVILNYFISKLVVFRKKKI